MASKISIRVHPGAEPWAPPLQSIQELSKHIAAPVEIEIFHRREVRRLWAKNMPNRPYPGDYAFRAWTRGSHVTILVDDTETPGSVLWVIAHELTHADINKAPFLDIALRGIPKPERYEHEDQAHEAWPEEQIANLVADQWAPRLGSRPGLNRLWWRERVDALTGRAYAGAP